VNATVSVALQALALQAWKCKHLDPTAFSNKKDKQQKRQQNKSPDMSHSQA